VALTTRNTNDDGERKGFNTVIDQHFNSNDKNENGSSDLKILKIIGDFVKTGFECSDFL